MKLTVSELAALAGGHLLAGDGGALLGGFNSLAEAGPGDLSFFGNEKYLPALRQTRATAVLVPAAVPPGFAEMIQGPALIAVANPSHAFAQVMEKATPPAPAFQPGFHPTAVVDPSAACDPHHVCLGPHTVVEAGAAIGAGTTIGAGGFVGRGARIGQNTFLHPRVSILDHCVVGDRVILHSGVVIGSDGFGFEHIGGRREKIAQTGLVQIDDDVEIGANTCVDRARFGKTCIGAGTKIDNLVQIAHNVVIGKNCVIAAQTGVAGSTRLHDGVILAAQVGVAGHLELHSGVIVTAQSGTSKSLTEPGPYMGFHAEPLRKMLRILAGLHQLPEIIRRVRELEKRPSPPSGQS